MAFILENITDNSLVLIDELGRGTSPVEGFGITQAICEALLPRKAFIFFATHFHGLASALSTYKNVAPLHFTTIVCIK